MLCSTHSSLTLKTSRIPNHVVWATSSGYTKLRVHIFRSGALQIPNHVSILEQYNRNIIPLKDTIIPCVVQPCYPVNSQVLLQLHEKRHTIQSLLIGILHTMVGYRFHCISWLAHFFSIRPSFTYFHLLSQSHSQSNPMDATIPDPTDRILVALHSLDLDCVGAQRIIFLDIFLVQFPHLLSDGSRTPRIWLILYLPRNRCPDSENQDTLDNSLWWWWWYL